MKTLFAIIFVLLITVVVAVSIVIIAGWHGTLGDTDVRLSFRSFRKFYGIAPEKYNTDSKTISFCHSDGRPDTKVRTVWTQKGRLMIHEVLTKRGIKALMDR